MVDDDPYESRGENPCRRDKARVVTTNSPAIPVPIEGRNDPPPTISEAGPFLETVAAAPLGYTIGRLKSTTIRKAFAWKRPA
jgi:hypothetical protein